MKKLFPILMVALLAFAACQQPTADTEQQAETPVETLDVVKAVFPVDSVAPDGRSFHGKRIDGADAMPVSQLSEYVSTSGPSNVTVSGELTDVCQAKGCWMMMKLDDENEMRVTFQDYGFFVPTNSSGKNATVRGTVKMDTTSVADLVHYAVDKGMSEEDAKKKYTEPEVALTFVADGVVIQ